MGLVLIVTTILILPGGAFLHPLPQMTHLEGGHEGLGAVQASPSSSSEGGPGYCVLYNGTIGYGGAQMIDDTENGYLYITGGAGINVYNGTSFHFMGYIDLLQWGLNPSALAWNPSRDVLYAADLHSTSVEEIDGRSNQVISNLTVPRNPQALAYDSMNGQLYVGTEGWGPNPTPQVVVVNASRWAVVDTILLGSAPSSIAVDPASNLVFLAGGNGDNVTVINGSSNTILRSISTGEVYPGSLTFDPSTGRVYSDGGDLGNTTAEMPIIDGSDGEQIGTLAVPGTVNQVGGTPQAIVSVPYASELFVSVPGPETPETPGTVIVNTSTGALVGKIPMVGLAWAMTMDGSTGNVLIASSGGFLYEVSPNKSCVATQSNSSFWSSTLLRAVILTVAFIAVVTLAVWWTRARRVHKGRAPKDHGDSG